MYGHPDSIAVDGFTWAQIKEFVFDSVVSAICKSCGAFYRVEPDARDYDCTECGERGSVTSPLVKLELI